MGMVRYCQDERLVTQRTIVTSGVWYGMVWSGRKSCYANLIRYIPIPLLLSHEVWQGMVWYGMAKTIGGLRKQTRLPHARLSSPLISLLRALFLSLSLSLYSRERERERERERPDYRPHISSLLSFPSCGYCYIFLERERERDRERERNRQYSYGRHFRFYVPRTRYYLLE